MYIRKHDGSGVLFVVFGWSTRKHQKLKQCLRPLTENKTKDENTAHTVGFSFKTWCLHCLRWNANWRQPLWDLGALCYRSLVSLLLSHKWHFRNVSAWRHKKLHTTSHKSSSTPPGLWCAKLLELPFKINHLGKRRFYFLNAEQFSWQMYSDCLINFNVDLF